MENVPSVTRQATTMEQQTETKTDNTAPKLSSLTLRLLMSYTYGATSKARNANVVYIWTYVWQR